MPIALSATASDAVNDPSLITNSNRGVINFDAYTQTVGIAIGSAPIVTSKSSAGNAAPFKQSDTSPNAVESPEYGYCGDWKVIKTYKKQQEKFYNLYSDGSAAVDESTGTTHKISIGLKFSDGGWGGHGTADVDTTTSSGGSNAFSGNRQLSNLINYAHYSRFCDSVPGGFSTVQRVQATGFYDFLTSYPSTSPRTWASCDPHYSGTERRSSGSGQKFSAGIETPFLDLSVEVAYSRDYTVTWTIPKQGEDMCGSTVDGFGSAPFAGGQAIPSGGGGGGCGAPDTSNVADGSDAEVLPSQEADPGVRPC